MIEEVFCLIDIDNQFTFFVWIICFSHLYTCSKTNSIKKENAHNSNKNNSPKYFLVFMHRDNIIITSWSWVCAISEIIVFVVAQTQENENSSIRWIALLVKDNLVSVPGMT